MRDLPDTIMAEERLLLAVSQMLWEMVKEREATAADLSRATNIGTRRIKRIMRGEEDFTIYELARLAKAVGCVPRVTIFDEEKTLTPLVGPVERATEVIDQLAQTPIPSGDVEPTAFPLLPEGGKDDA